MDLIDRKKINNIQILGYISGESKYEILSKSIANIVPSKCYENCPIIIIECLRMGIPVISNNLGAIPEFIRDRYNGFIYNYKDLNSLKKLILTMYNMNKGELLLMHNNCMESYFNLFDIDKNFKIIDRVYKSTYK